MSDKIFIDSNILLYAIEEQDLEKAGRASEWLRYLIANGRGVTNLQVINEVTNVLLKRKLMSPEEVFQLVDGYASFGSTSVSVDTVAAARLIRFETNYQWWDCVLLAAAMELGCTRFLSEDLQDGHGVRGLTIVDPFRQSPTQLPLH